MICGMVYRAESVPRDVVADDPVLPVRRRKSRHAADVTVTMATVSQPDRQAHSDSEQQHYEPVRDADAITSLSTSLRLLPTTTLSTTVTSRHVTVTSAAVVDHTAPTHGSRSAAAALYSEPLDVQARRRQQDRTTASATSATRRTSDGDVTAPARPTHRPGTSVTVTSTQQQQQADDVDRLSSSSSDSYESVEYSDDTAFYQQQSRSKQQVRDWFPCFLSLKNKRLW